MSTSYDSSVITLSEAPPGTETGDPFRVTLDPSDNPQQWSVLRKWTILVVITSAAFLVGCASSIVALAFIRHDQLNLSY